MLGETFNHDTIRKYVIAFGSLFNEIYLNRTDNSNAVQQSILVPLTYAPKDKLLQRVKGDPNLDRPVAMVLPHLAFEWTTMNYDGNRKHLSINKVAVVEDSEKSRVRYQYNGVPYDFSFNLYIMAKNTVDGTRLIEQILPFFHPEFSSEVDLIPELNLTYDITVQIAGSPTIEDVYEGNFDQRRAIIWTIPFILKGYLFGPTKKKPLIKKAITNMYATPVAVPMLESAANNSERDFTSTITPGLTANGEPTTNAELTIDYTEIQANDPWDYIIQFERGLIEDEDD